MPIVKCVLCGYRTNTAVSSHLDANSGEANGCYARLDKDGKWAKGCNYNFADVFEKTFANNIINTDWEKQREKNIEEILLEDILMEDVRIGEYTIKANYKKGTILISNNDDEAGEFQEKDLGKVIDKFFKENL